MYSGVFREAPGIENQKSVTASIFGGAEKCKIPTMLCVGIIKSLEMIKLDVLYKQTYICHLEYFYGEMFLSLVYIIKRVT